MPIAPKVKERMRSNNERHKQLIEIATDLAKDFKKFGAEGVFILRNAAEIAAKLNGEQGVHERFGKLFK